MSKVKEKNCSGDPCLWLCFPCLFTWMLCEKDYNVVVCVYVV